MPSHTETTATEVASLLEEARAPETTPERLRRLARSGDREVLSAVVSHPNTPFRTAATVGRSLPDAFLARPDARALLSKKTFSPEESREIPLATMLSLAERAKALPEGLLAHLRAAFLPSLQIALCKNPNVDLEVRWGVLLEQEEPRLQSILKPLRDHPDFKDLIVKLRSAGLWGDPDVDMPLEELEWLADLPGVAPALVARHPLTPAHLLEQLKQSPDFRVRAFVASHESAPPELIEELCRDGDHRVCAAAAAHRHAPDSFKQVILHPALDHLQAFGALSPNLPPEDLAELSAHPNPDVRAAVARHEGSPMEVLERLAQDVDIRPRRGVAQNPKASAALLRRLADDPESEVIEGLSANPSAPPEVMVTLAERARSPVRRKMASSKAAPAAAMEVLATDKLEGVRSILARNPRATSSVLARLARDPSAKVRAKVARNTSSPPETLERLISDPDEKVAELAKRNRRAPKQLDLQEVERRRFELECLLGAVRELKVEVEELELRWCSEPQGKGRLRSFVGRLPDGRYCLFTRLTEGGPWEWITGDRDLVLASVPDEFFEEAVEAALS